MAKFSSYIKVILVASILLVSVWALGCTSPATTPTNNTTSSPTSGAVKQYTMATGGTSGTYYPVGGGIANVVNNATLGFQISPESTQASVANCRLVQTKKDDFAIVQNDVAYAAYKGILNFQNESPLTDIRGVTALYPETIQCYALKSSGIKSIPDLKGKRIVVGDKGSGTEFNTLQILSAYGLTKDDIIEDYRAISGAADLIKNGQADAAFFTGGAPTAGISDLAFSNDIVIVPISGAERSKLLNMSPFYANDSIKAGTYKGVDKDVDTVSVMSMIIVNKNVPDNDVYNLLKTIYDPNKNALFTGSHARVANISASNGLAGMSIPLHPGAQKYFDELGIKK